MLFRVNFLLFTFYSYIFLFCTMHLLVFILSAIIKNNGNDNDELILCNLHLIIIESVKKLRLEDSLAHSYLLHLAAPYRFIINKHDYLSVCNVVVTKCLPKFEL